MSEEAPPPAFPQYAPPGVTVIDPKQQKPLMKILNRRLHPRPKTRVSPVKNRVAKKKKSSHGYL